MEGADDRIGYEGRDIHMPTGPEGMGPIAKAMYDTIVGIQTGEIESDWSVVANDAK
jgi:branched-chain amino acid aminotransferase